VFTHTIFFSAQEAPIPATMACTQRTNKEMQIKSKQALQKATDPLEKLQLACLARGATGIKGLAR
jgi:hypothetical protein